MDIKGITTVFPVANIAAGVAKWREILGADPAFVDGERWAQFNIGATIFTDLGSLPITSAAL